MTEAPGFRIRPASPADVDQLVAARAALFRELGEGPDDASRRVFDAACRSAIQSTMNGSHCLAWLADTNGAEVIGSLVMLLFPRLPSPQMSGTAEGYILNVYTAPAWRGRGIASALLAAAEAEARQRGLARIRLHATALGRMVYERAGYRARTDEMELLLDSPASA